MEKVYPTTRSDLLLLEVQVKQQLDSGEIDEKLMYKYIQTNRDVIESVYRHLSNLEDAVGQCEKDGIDKFHDGTENSVYRSYKNCAEQLRLYLTNDKEGIKEYATSMKKRKLQR